MSQGVSASCYGSEVGDVMLPRKALYPLRHHGLYPKPTQVGW